MDVNLAGMTPRERGRAVVDLILNEGDAHGLAAAFSEQIGALVNARQKAVRQIALHRDAAGNVAGSDVVETTTIEQQAACLAGMVESVIARLVALSQAVEAAQAAQQESTA